MREAIGTLTALCLMAALSEQLLGGGRLFGAVRTLLGLEIARVLVAMVEGALRALG